MEEWEGYDDGYEAAVEALEVKQKEELKKRNEKKHRSRMESLDWK